MIATTSGIIFIPFLVARSVELLLGEVAKLLGDGMDGMDGMKRGLAHGRFSDFCFVNHWVMV